LKRRDEVFLAFLEDQLERLKAVNMQARKPEYAEKIKELENLLYN
jgi:hypothetical protein